MGATRSIKPNGIKLFPAFTALVPPDTALLAFEIAPDALIGTDTVPGYFFVFEQPPAGLHLGLDTSATGAAPPTWSDLSWAHVGAATEGAFASLTTEVTPTTQASADTRRWGPASHAGMIASLLIKKPFRVAMHAASLLVPHEN